MVFMFILFFAILWQNFKATEIRNLSLITFFYIINAYITNKYIIFIFKLYKILHENIVRKLFFIIKRYKRKKKVKKGKYIPKQ